MRVKKTMESIFFVLALLEVQVLVASPWLCRNAVTMTALVGSEDFYGSPPLWSGHQSRRFMWKFAPQVWRDSPESMQVPRIHYRCLNQSINRPLPLKKETCRYFPTSIFRPVFDYPSLNQPWLPTDAFIEWCVCVHLLQLVAEGSIESFCQWAFWWTWLNE